MVAIRLEASDVPLFYYMKLIACIFIIANFYKVINSKLTRGLWYYETRKLVFFLFCFIYFIGENMNTYKGLTDEEVIISRNKNGSNKISEYKRNNLFNFIIESLNDPIIKILLIALGIKIIFFLKDSDIYETVGIIVAIILATLISSMSEYASEKAFEKLSNDTISNAKVIRNGVVKTVDVEQLVVDDLLFLESGDKVGADCIVISKTISVDESAITGESKEKYKNINDEIYMGSTVISGRCIAKVIKVGDNTYYGKIAKDIKEKAPISPLKEKLKVLASFISKVGYICALLVMSSYLISTILIKGITSFEELVPHILYSLTLAITVVVVAVPEGLPMMITLVLSSNMKKLIKNNVLVRKLVGIESAGSLNILFTDKTGTLTNGKLTMTDFVLHNNVRFNKFKDINNKLKELIYISLVYNNESIIMDKVMLGNTTDQAIIKFVNSSNKDKYEVLNRTLFDSKNKYSSVTINYNNKTTFYKGAYELIIDKCSFYYDTNAKRKVLDKSIMALANEYTKKGYRTLACAVGNEEFSNLTFLGLVLIKDEVRKEIKEAVSLVTDAGVQTVMITGDNELTATSVAKEIGLITNDKDLVLTHSDIEKKSDEEIKRLLPSIKVIARSLPEDKKRLVSISQSLGLVTGMTGDGVNDAPALKRADVGFAMGSASEVAKEVSDIIVLDDNYMSIAKTILFGRTIFKSIRKFIIFQLSTNMVAMMLSVIAPLLGITSPVTLVQMLWINMIMDTLAGVAYSFEPPLIEYMKEKPKKREENIMNKYMINEIIVTGLFMGLFCLLFLKSDFLQSFYRIDKTNKYIMTAFFSIFIFMSVFNAFNARTHRLNIFANLHKNKAFLSVVAIIVIVQLIMIYYGGTIFRTTGLTIKELNITLFLSSLVIPFDFLRKLILKKLKKPLGV